MQADPDGLSLPDFLRINAEERRKGWERFLASRGGRYTDPWRDGGEGVQKRDWTRPRSLTDEEWAYWQDIEARKADAKREADQPRFEAMRAKAKEDKEARAAVREAVRASMSTTVAKRPRRAKKPPPKKAATKTRKKGRRK